jgi:hypothetical protein
MKRAGVSQKFEKVKKKIRKKNERDPIKTLILFGQDFPPLTREISRILSNEISGTRKKKEDYEYQPVCECDRDKV